LKVNCVVTLIGSPASVAGFHVHCFAASIAAFAKSGSPVEAAPVASLVSRAVEVEAAAGLAANFRVAAVAVEQAEGFPEEAGAAGEGIHPISYRSQTSPPQA
jgi:hypothetical protein